MDSTVSPQSGMRLPTCSPTMFRPDCTVRRVDARLSGQWKLTRSGTITLLCPELNDASVLAINRIADRAFHFRNPFDGVWPGSRVGTFVVRSCRRIRADDQEVFGRIEEAVTG